LENIYDVTVVTSSIVTVTKHLSHLICKLLYTRCISTDGALVASLHYQKNIYLKQMPDKMVSNRF